MARPALAFTEDVAPRFAAYGWHVQRVDDGNDLEAIDAAIRRPRRARPTARRSSPCRTHIGYGSPHKQDTSAGPRRAARRRGGAR